MKKIKRMSIVTLFALGALTACASTGTSGAGSGSTGTGGSSSGATGPNSTEAPMDMEATGTTTP